MKKTTKLWFMLAIASVSALSSCKKDEEEEPIPVTTVDECAEAVYPTATGDATIDVLNFASTTIEVEAGNTLALAVGVTKGSSRTKKLRLFASDCINSLGTEYSLADQPKGGANGIDLRNTDDVQTRNVNYVVPTGYTPIYLTIQIDEGGGNTNYLQLTLNVSGSGLLTLTENVELGGGGNSNPARMASATGLTYTACNAPDNIEYVDITYAVGTDDGGANYYSYICANPARFLAPINKGASKTAAGCDPDDPTAQFSTAGGNASYFAAYSGSLTPATATDADLEALTSVTTSSPQYAQVTAVGEKFEFINVEGQKGLIEVMAINQVGNTAGSVTVSVVVQR